MQVLSIGLMAIPRDIYMRINSGERVQRAGCEKRDSRQLIVAVSLAADVAWAMSLLFLTCITVGSIGARQSERHWKGRSRSVGLVFLPYLVGKRSPVAVPKATGFSQAAAWYTPYHMLRAVLEGCTYAVLRVIRTCKFPNVTEIRAVETVQCTRVG